MRQESKYLKDGGKPKFLPQLLSAIAISFGATVVGGWMSFTSVAIPKMMKVSPNIDNITGTSEADPIQIDLHTGSWIASLFFIGNIIGCLMGGFLNQKIGPKRDFLVFSSFLCPNLGNDCSVSPCVGHFCVKNHLRHCVPTLPIQWEGVQC